MIFTDSHCHLTMSNAEANLRAAREAGVRGFVVPGTNGKDAPQAVQIARQNPDVWSAVGFHPHDAKHCDDAAFAEIARLAREERVVAIGEIGLDYHYMHSERGTQREVFERHIALAKELDKPIIVHNRESTDDMVEVLVRSGARGILHSYTESLDVAKKLVDLGFVISFSGIVTFKSADVLREVARALPPTRCSSRPTRRTSRRCLSRAGQRAGVRREDRGAAGEGVGVSVSRVAEATTSNFERVFSVSLSR
jgi:TatD DNase family protein